MSSRYSAYTRLKIDFPADRILRLTFDRPETHNSVDAETHTQLTKIWRDINDDPDINAIIVTGAGKAFSAGGDFELIKSVLGDPVARMATWREAKDLVYNVINCNKPIISAINGVAVGAGLVVGILADVSMAIPASVSPLAMSPASSGLCCAGLRRPSTIYSPASRCRARKLSGSGWCHFAWKMPICRRLR
jgi:enoyl-CoA hydratase/carnithine racemase